MNRAGVLLDTGPLVAFLSQDDALHSKAVELFANCAPPFRCCEAVLAEACFLMKKVDRGGPAEVMALGRKGVYETPLRIDEQAEKIETLLKKYRNRPISLADACLIRTAEIFSEPRILTFDSDFRIYRWAGKRTFDVLTP